jgi:3-hydroxyacyl-[acyl-carrier-protein] dehydratase
MRKFEENRLIKEILPHRYPFLLVDQIVEIVPKKRAVCIKNVSFNEPFFEGHFPDMPVMPGVLIIEAAAQAAIFLFHENVGREVPEEREYMLSSTKADFHRPVFPGDQLMITVTADKLVSEAGIVKARCTVCDDLAARCELVVSAKKKKSN